MLCSNCKNEVDLKLCYCKKCDQKIEQIANVQQDDKEEKIDPKIILAIICSSFLSSLIMVITHNTNANRLF